MITLEEIDARNLPDEGDPLVWLYKYREELSKKYPTVGELMEYYRSVPPVAEIRARLQVKIAAKKQVAPPVSC